MENISKSLRIVFMGTPDFAVAPLQKLVEEGYNVVAVVTMPDKPVGRGQKLTASPIKNCAVEHSIPVLQPERMKDEEFISQLKKLDLDLGIVVAFKMLPEVVWSMPKFGTFNLHTSLLPDYRGAAPINWAVINGDKESGVTTFFLDKDMDTGAIIGQSKTPISDTMSAGELHDKLQEIGSDLVVESVEKIAKGKVELLSQDSIKDSQMRPAPKIFKADCQIDWSNDIDSIYNKVRGLSPYPASWTLLKDNNFKIFETEREYANHSFECGEIFTDNKSYLKVACNGGYIKLLELQLSGKKRVKIEDFLRGARLFN